MKKYNNEPLIVSFTTYPARYHVATKFIYQLLNKQTFTNFHLVATIFKEDYEKISEELKLFIDHNLLEVIIGDLDLGPHLKYFYTMQKYPNLPIMTLDDDKFYPSDTVQNFYNAFMNCKEKCVLAPIAPCLKKNGDKLVPYNEWCNGENRLKPGEISYLAMAEGFGGVLYPPFCFHNLKEELPELLKCIKHDDLFLKVLEIKNKVSVMAFSTTPGRDIEQNLFGLNRNMKYRYDVTNYFEKELLKAFEL